MRQSNQKIWGLWKKEIGCMVFGAASFVVCLLLSVILYNRISEESIYNKARLVLQEDLEVVRQLATEDEATAVNNLSAGNITHFFYLVQLDGVITESNEADYPVGMKLNLTKDLQLDHAYSKEHEGALKVVFPIEKEGKIATFAVFRIAREELVSRAEDLRSMLCLLPLAVWGLCYLIFTGSVIWRMNKKIFTPMRQMTESSKAIVAGDYSRQLVQRRLSDKPQDEMENLIYSFENMRDELRNQSEREVQLRREQKELLSCMSHDLRTPITTIQAHAEAIRDGIVQTEEQQKDYLATIIRKTELLNRMIADLLDHSNAQLNQLKIERCELYFKAYMQELSHELSTYCKKSGCDFLYENDMKEVLVCIDSNRITQVIYNLVENACKYMHAGESVVDEQSAAHLASAAGEPSCVTLSCHMNPQERRIYVKVQDNGAGIEMIDIPYVFDRFYRAEKSRSMQIPGAGLGLSICQYIVKAHEGEISLQSRKGIGTEVTFYLNY